MNKTVAVLARIAKLFMKMDLPVPTRRDLKTQAKLAKGFCVLLKRKLQREQLCRGQLFRKLMALVFDPEEKDCFFFGLSAAFPMLSFLFKHCPLVI